MNILCLYDYTGIFGRPWAEAGHTVYCLDIQHPAEPHVKYFSSGGKIVFQFWDAIINRPAPPDIKWDFVATFPPCTDLAVSGAAHFANKLDANPNYLQEAMDLVYRARDIGEASGAPYFIENPVSRISTEWRKPDFMFDPWEFGWYLPIGPHPIWPDLIAPQDAYVKKTCLWTGGGFEIPEHKPVPPDWMWEQSGYVNTPDYERFMSAWNEAKLTIMPRHQWHIWRTHKLYSTQHRKLGGKSLKTKNIRSATPAGFAQAVFERYGK